MFRGAISLLLLLLLLLSAFVKAGVIASIVPRHHQIP
jgi:hypothetical protein